MRVQKKTVSVLLLSKREIDHLFHMVNDASEGHTVHYAEMQTGANQFFGVSVDDTHDELNRPNKVKPKQPLPTLPVEKY